MEARIWNDSTWIRITDPEAVKAALGGVLNSCGFSVLNFMEHHFEPQGYTAIWLLGESHLAVHTFPEHGKSYVELSSCNRHKHCKYLLLLDCLEVEV